MARHAKPPPRAGDSDPAAVSSRHQEFDALATLAEMIDRSSLGNPAARVDRMNGADESVAARRLVAGHVAGAQRPSAVDIELELARRAGARGDLVAVDLAHRTILAEPISNRTWATQREVATQYPNIHLAWLRAVAGHRERSFPGHRGIVTGSHHSTSGRPATLVRRFGVGAAAALAIVALLSALHFVKAHEAPPLWLVYGLLPIAATSAAFLSAWRPVSRPRRPCRTIRCWSSEVARRVEALSSRVDALQDLDREILRARVTTRLHRQLATLDRRADEAEVLGSIEDRFDLVASCWSELIGFAGWGRQQAAIFAERCEVVDARFEARRGLEAEAALMRVASVIDPVTGALERIRDEAGQFGLMPRDLDFVDLIEEARSLLGRLVAECEATVFVHRRLYRLAALAWLRELDAPRLRRAYVRWAMSLTTDLPFLSWSTPSVRCAAFVQLAAGGISIRRVLSTIRAVLRSRGPDIDAVDVQGRVDEMVGLS